MTALVVVAVCGVLLVVVLLVLLAVARKKPSRHAAPAELDALLVEVRGLVLNTPNKAPASRTAREGAIKAVIDGLPSSIRASLIQGNLHPDEAHRIVNLFATVQELAPHLPGDLRVSAPLRFIATLEEALKEAELRREAAWKARRLAEADPSWGSEVAGRLVAKELWVGETEEQVIFSFGKPAAVEESVLKTKTKRVFKYHPQPRGFGLKIRFDNGKVVGWDR